MAYSENSGNHVFVVGFLWYLVRTVSLNPKLFYSPGGKARRVECVRCFGLGGGPGGEGII